jgi:hypothetical protein
MSSYFPIELHLDEVPENCFYIYVKRHSTTTTTTTTNSSEIDQSQHVLFVANVPIQLNEKGIEACFEDCSVSNVSQIEYFQTVR